MGERKVSGTELIAELPSILDDIAYQGTIYLVHLGPAPLCASVISGLVNPVGEMVFVLGRPEDLGQVFGLIDAEYGWPYPVDVANLVSIEEVIPGHRRHPMLYRDRGCVAMSISWWEYERIRASWEENPEHPSCK